jgi:hypothetical protein
VPPLPQLIAQTSDVSLKILGRSTPGCHPDRGLFGVRRTHHQLLRTPEPQLFRLTIGRGNDVEVTVVKAVGPMILGEDVKALLSMAALGSSDASRTDIVVSRDQWNDPTDEWPVDDPADCLITTVRMAGSGMRPDACLRLTARFGFPCC